MLVKPICTGCGGPLRQFALFRQRCPACGLRHRAVRGPMKALDWIWAVLFGGFGPLIWLLSIAVLPLAVWVFLPVLAIIASFPVALARQRWIAAPELGAR